MQAGWLGWLAGLWCCGVPREKRAASQIPSFAAFPRRLASEIFTVHRHIAANPRPLDSSPTLAEWQAPSGYI